MLIKKNYVGLGTSNTGINTMVDTHNYYVYENQRWNPVTGYTAHGLPTDRYMWSDATGRHKCTREHTKLLSMHWHWVSEREKKILFLKMNQNSSSLMKKYIKNNVYYYYIFFEN